MGDRGMDRLINRQLSKYNKVLMLNSKKKTPHLLHKAKYTYLTNRIKV